MIRKAVRDLSAEDLLASPGPESTCLLWNYGHVANTRCGLLQLLGVEHPRFHNDLFGRGANHADRDKLPDAEAIAAAFEQAAEKLQARFETLTDADLSAPCPREFPLPDKSIAGAVSFLALHEIYHAGQMAYLRKWLGKGQLVG